MSGYTGYIPGREETFGKTPIAAQDEVLHPGADSVLSARGKEGLELDRVDPSVADWRDKPPANLWPMAQKTPQEMAFHPKENARASSVNLGDPRLQHIDTMYTRDFSHTLPGRPQGDSEWAALTNAERLDAYARATKRFGGASLDHVFASLRLRLNAKMGRSNNNGFRLRNLFGGAGAGGRVSLYDFSRALETCGVQLMHGQVLAVFAQFDIRGEGTLLHDEFMRKVLDSDYYALFSAGNTTTDFASDEEAQRYFSNLLSHKFQSERSIRHALQRKDVGCSGTMTVAELLEELEEYGLKLPLQAQRNLLAPFLDEDHQVRYMEFLEKFGG